MDIPPRLSDAEILARARRATRDAQIHALIYRTLGRNARADQLASEVLGAVHYYDDPDKEES